MPSPQPGSDRLRLELDILASELDGDVIPLAAPIQSPSAPHEVSGDDGTNDPGLADGDLLAPLC